MSVVILAADAGGPTLRLCRTARWGESDPAGIIYTPCFLHWAVEVVEQFFRLVLAAPWEELREQNNLAVPFVHASLDFVRPVAVGDSVETALVLERVGRTSLTYSVIGLCVGKHCFTARLVSVFVDSATAAPTPIPDELRAKAVGFETPYRAPPTKSN